MEEERAEILNLPKPKGEKSIMAIVLKGGNSLIDRGDVGVHVDGGKGSMNHS
jgi:hypothetical protein